MSDELTLDSSNDGFEKEQQRQAASKISDEQLKKLALQHSKKEGTFKRPTEVIDLPSKGMLYDTTNLLSSGQIEMYHPTARDEDILMTSSKIKKGTVIDDFISSLIASPINYDDLLVGDRDKLVIVARILAYGAKYQATVNDPDIPSESQDIEFNLQDVEEIGVNESETTPNTNLFSFKLPTSELTVSFKLPTVGMNKKIDEEIKRAKQLSTKVDRSLSVRLKHLIVDIEGESSRSVINDFVDNQLLTMDSKALRTYIKSVSPGIDLSYNYISDLTDKQRRLEIPIGNPNFFGLTAKDKPLIYRQVFELCYYGQGGFTFNEVMDMPIWLRRFYIQEINKEIKREQDAIKKQNKGNDVVNPNAHLKDLYNKTVNKPR